MGNDKHKPGCAVNHPKSGKPWFMSCTCGIGSPPVCPHDGNALRPSCVYVPCLHYHPGKTNCGLIKPTPPHKARAKDGMPFDYCPACEQQLDTGWECISGCGRDWQAYARSQLKSAPPAPTADAVREARERLVWDTQHPITKHAGDSPYCEVDASHLRTILAALDRAQEEARIMTVSRDHYVSELALAQGEVEYQTTKARQYRMALDSVKERKNALRAENARLVEELKAATSAVHGSAFALTRLHRVEAENAAQAEQIERLRQALERIRDDVGYFDTAVAVATQALKASGK